MDPSTYEEGIHGYYDGVEVVFPDDHAVNTLVVTVGGILILVALLVVGFGIWYLVCHVEKKRLQEPTRIQREENEELLDFPRGPYILEPDAQQLV